jgi:phosphatidyl-myo-inositol alpha-mannosyltransferase
VDPTEPSSPPTSPSWRVALVCPYSLSRPGGVQGQVLGLARTLGRRGHRPTVFAPLDGPPPTGSVPTGPALDVVATGRSVSLPANGSVAPVTRSVPAVVRGVRAIRSGGYDVVHIHEPFTPGLAYGLMLAGGVPPMVGTFHRSGKSSLYAALGPVARRMASRLAVRCAVSEAARGTASDALGGAYEVGFNGVEVDGYRDVDPWPTDRPTVLFLGRHEPRKGLRYLLQAFDHLDTVGEAGRSTGRSGPPVLWVAGDGPETAELRRLHPESDRVRWLGVLSEEEKVRRLVAADVLCAPSVGGESFGMVLVEAMAAGTAVVASDIDGYRDAAGGHAVLVPPGDAGALTRALAGVLVGGATGLDEAGRWASHWSMDGLAAWYEDIYRAAMVGRGR